MTVSPIIPLKSVEAQIIADDVESTVTLHVRNVKSLQYQTI